MRFKIILLFVVLSCIPRIGDAQELLDKTNIENEFGRQGYWKIYDKKGRIKQEGNYLNGKKIKEWKHYKYKRKKRYKIYFYEFSSEGKELKSIYVNDVTCAYKYEKVNGKMQITKHYNLNW